MTEPLNAKIWAIAWPAIVSNISIPLLGLADAAILGHLDSSRHLAAVAIGSAILSFLYWGFSFLRMGTTGEVARAVGRGDVSLAFLALGRASILALSLAAALLLLQTPLLSLGLTAMASEPDLEATAKLYGHLRLLSAPAVLFTYAIVGWFIGQQDTRWPMAILIVTNLLNIALDLLFIVGLGLASAGAALATVVAEYAGLLIALFGVYRKGVPQISPELRRKMLELRGLRDVLRSNFELFVRTLILLFAFAFFTAAGERLGTNTVAANAIMLQFLLFAAFALDGFAYAAEGLAGEALGGGEPRRFHEVALRCGLWSGGTAIVVSLLILVSRSTLFPLLSSLPEVRAVMQAQGMWLVVLPLVSAPSYLLDGLFIGAGATRAMMVTMVLSAVVVYLPAWYLTTDLGNNGLWLSLALFNSARGVSLGWCYWRFTRERRWQTWSPDPAA